ncbi:hypothetical protein MKW98_009987 [Papaver atlanticum]|uniref:Uncharacterized protein n=1 Tax=Papaver atlanticum TaxID=357466 RepID=A0AAD4T1B4_9MAGN|nr:hypothetical protein MKW98_009987 [Papaver atlanticum]
MKVRLESLFKLFSYHIICSSYYCLTSSTKFGDAELDFLCIGSSEAIVKFGFTCFIVVDERGREDAIEAIVIRIFCVAGTWAGNEKTHLQTSGWWFHIIEEFIVLCKVIQGGWGWTVSRWDQCWTWYLSACLFESMMVLRFFSLVIRSDYT